MKYKKLKMTHRDLTTNKTPRHLQIQPQRYELTKFAKKKKEHKRNGNPQSKEEERGEE
jgi:hypothetical protein